MTPLTQVKLIVAGFAFVLFVAGLRLDHAGLRWSAIILLFAVFLLRFYKPMQ